MTDTGWHYSLGDGKSNGPISFERLSNAIAAGELSEDDLVWHESLIDWQHVASVPSLASARPQTSTPPPVPPPFQRQQSPQNSFDHFINKARRRVESLGAGTLSPASMESKNDTWGAISYVVGAMSGGLLLVSLWFSLMACCAVPVSIGGIVSALFSDNMRLRKVGLIGNSIVLFITLAIVIRLSSSMTMVLEIIDRY
jgi:hypothetical protein